MSVFTDVNTILSVNIAFLESGKRKKRRAIIIDRLKGQTNARHQSKKAYTRHWRHMAFSNVVKQPFLYCCNENLAL